MQKRTWVIAIVGGSGSGKTTLAKKIKTKLDIHGCLILGQDSYYIDQSSRFDRDGGSVNFDHPSSLEFTLLAHHIQDLKAGRGIQIPVYDFATHMRLPSTESCDHHSMILVDGTLILSQPQLLPLFDESIFIEVDEDTRFQRRLKRDVEERGRTPEGVHEQFYSQVKTMHDQFVEPSKALSSILIQQSKIQVQIDACSEFQPTLLELLRQVLSQQASVGSALS